MGAGRRGCGGSCLVLVVAADGVLGGGETTSSLLDWGSPGDGSGIWVLRAGAGMLGVGSGLASVMCCGTAGSIGRLVAWLDPGGGLP